MAVRRHLAGLIVLALVAAACGDDAGEATVAESAPIETLVATEAAPVQSDAPTSSAAPTTPTLPATPATGPPGIAALTSGRGDDGSLEIGVWFNSNPFEDDTARLLVGTDADGSYPGTGDPVPHIDGWAELADGAVSLLDGGNAIADETTGDLDDWLSWTGPGQLVWVYFIGNVPVRAGTVWIALEIDGEVAAAGVAGAPFGDGCSYHSAGMDLGPLRGDVPDFGAPCRYPLG